MQWSSNIILDTSRLGTVMLKLCIDFKPQRVGPIVNCCCMRFESNNSYFKNICYSVAKRYQRLMCGYLQGKFFSLNVDHVRLIYLANGIAFNCHSINTGKIMTQVMDDILKEQILEQLPSTSYQFQGIIQQIILQQRSITIFYYRPNWIKIYGQKYSRTCCVHMGWQPDDLPLFGRVVDVLIVGGCPLLWLQHFATEGINVHLQSYQVSHTLTKSLVVLSSLENKSVFTPHTYLGDHNQYITMRSYVIRQQQYFIAQVTIRV